MAICRDAQPASASMIHARNSDTRTLDVPRFNEAFMMHTSTSLHYGVIASCDIASRMMQGSAGRSLVKEMHAEAISFRHATRRSEESRVGKEWVSLGGSRWSRYNYKNNYT